MMKEILFLSSLFLSSSLICSELYLGVDAGYDLMSQECKANANSSNEDFQSLTTNLKVGYGDSKGLSAEVIYGFSMANFQYKDTAILQELGLNLKYGFTIVNDLNLFVLAGSSYGMSDTNLINNDYLSQQSELSSQSFIAYRGGLGLSYRVNSTLELLGGANYIYRDFEDMTISETMRPLGAYEFAQSKSDSGYGLYFGANFYFHFEGQKGSLNNLQPNDEFADQFKNQVK